MVIDLLQNNYDGCQQQVADEEALIGTEQEMTDMVKNELRRYFKISFTYFDSNDDNKEK